MYVTTLCRSEEEFWRSTLRKVISQINIYREIHGGNTSKTDDGKVVVDNKEYEVFKVS